MDMIKPPEGLELPEEGEVELTSTFLVSGGMLSLVAIEGMPLPESSEVEEPGGEPVDEANFLAAVERKATQR
jgi:hypothetical protein